MSVSKSATAKHLWKSLLVLAALALLVLLHGVVLVAFASVLVGMFLYYPAQRLQKISNIPHVYCVILVGLGYLLCLLAIVLVLGQSIASEVQTLMEQVPQAMDRVSQWLSELSDQGESAQNQKQSSGTGDTTQDNKQSKENASLGTLSTWLQEPIAMIQGASQYFRQGFSAVGYVGSGLISIGVIVIIALFMASEPQRYRDMLAQLIPPDRREKGTEVMHNLIQTLTSWIKGKLLSMLFVLIASAIGLLILGIPGAVVLGLLSGLLTFIPNIGPICSAVIPIILGFSTGGWSLALWVLGLFIVIQAVEGNLVTPLIHRQVAHIAPVMLILGQLTFYALLGLFGLILAAPLCVVIKVLVDDLYITPMNEQAQTS